MPSWEEILNEISNCDSKHAYDITRRKYLRQLSQLTGRNTIAYYSAWQRWPTSVFGSDINDNDMTGFMNAVKKMSCDKGLDLILHTPGGSPVAAESIVKYLRKKFKNDIRVIVPHMAMSAGTMIACSAKEILMGNQSSLGPIDPQFNGIPAYNIKKEFEEAKKDLQSHQENFAYWKIILDKYPAAFIKTAIDSIALSDILLREWLGSCMYSSPQDDAIIDRIVEKLNEHDSSKAHGRHFDMNFCISAGLKIKSIEEDNDLQDAILSVHHAYTHTISALPVVKIIESNSGSAYISTKQETR